MLAMARAPRDRRLNHGVRPVSRGERLRWSAHVDALAARNGGSTGWHSMEKEPLTAVPALAIQRSGWEYAPGTSVRVGPEFAWDSTVNLDRSLASQLQSWRFVDAVLLHHEETGSLEDLRWIADVVESWWSFARTNPSERSMAWTDWATTLRVPRLVTMMTRLARTSLRTWLPLLTGILIDHAERLATDEYFNPRNNHGFFAAAAQLTAATVLEPLRDVADWRRQGDARLRAMLDSQFAPDGGHREHSPSYHRLVLVALVDLLRSGLVAADDLPFRIEDAHAALAWMMQPNGRLVQFGDTGEDHAYVPDLGLADPADAFILSGGRQGSPGAAIARAFPESGWVFVRSPAPKAASDGDASYLAWLTGFHSRAHKHADDLTFVWCEGGTEIVVDGGKFGYGNLLEGDDPRRRQGHFYASEERRYVESTRAHNTVSLGAEGQIDRLRLPYGSGRPHLSESGSVFEMAARAEHETHVHERTLLFEPGRRLVVRDVLDLERMTDDITTWLNLNGSFRLERRDARAARFFDEASGFRVLLEVTDGPGEVTSLVHGQQDPLAGWRSIVDGDLVPAWNIGISCPARPRTVLAYRLSVGTPHSPLA